VVPNVSQECVALIFKGMVHGPYTLEYEGHPLLADIRKHSPSNAVSHLKRSESSTWKPLWWTMQ